MHAKHFTNTIPLIHLWVFWFFCARKTSQNAIWLVQVLKIACAFEFHSLKSWNWRLTHSLHISIQFISIWSFEYCVHISHDVYHLTKGNQSIIYINTYTYTCAQCIYLQMDLKRMFYKYGANRLTLDKLSSTRYGDINFTSLCTEG